MWGVKTLRFKWNTVSGIDLWIPKNNAKVTCKSASGSGAKASVYGCNDDSETGTLVGTLSVGAKLDVSNYKYIHIVSTYDSKSIRSEIEISY